MANRQSRRTTGNAIRGPHSALTDFLASHNISAQQISQDYQRRQAEAERQREQEVGTTAEDEDKENVSNDDEDPVERKKRKRKEEMTLMKIKQSKEFKKRKFEQQRDYGDVDDTALAKQMMQKAQPLPGQLENCDICEKRFTVTPYSKSGPSGGLCCTKCSKEMKDDEKKAQKANKKKPVQRVRKRQTASQLMEGDVKPGAKPLVEQCVRRVADVVNDIEEFGDLPQNLLDRLSQILSKRRVITSRTLQLFLQPGIDRIAIYDCGPLETEDFQRIFAFMPDLEMVNLRFAGQLKDESLLYMIEKNRRIRHLQLGATNLVSDRVWVELFQQLGPQLETLKLSELNDSLNDASMAELGKQCGNLKRLKLRSCSHITPASMEFIAQLTSLEHLSLAVAPLTPPAILVDLISRLGARLQTLSLENYTEADDSVLAAIRLHCPNLSKFRLTENSICSDQGFSFLFDRKTTIIPPLSFVDLSSNRDLESSSIDDDVPNTDRIGFASAAFTSLISHSGSDLRVLNLHSARQISHKALLDAFDGRRQYPVLQHIDISFVKHVDDVILTGIFKSCPKLAKLVVFGCFNARSVSIPPNIAVVGLPNAQQSIIVNADILNNV